MRRMYIRSTVVALAFALAVMSSCVLQVRVQGDVYIQYGWDTGIWDISDTNPTFVYVTAEDQYYLSEPGTYYASYQTFYGGYYVFNYVLTADSTYLGDPYGPFNTYFYLYLSNSGPIISDPVFYGRDLSDKEGSGKLLGRSDAATPVILATRENLGEPSSVLEKKLNGYTLHLESWKLR